MSDKIRYVYIMDGKTSRKRPVFRPVTVAYMFDDEKQCIVYNYARCSEKDQFVKAAGRLKASSRLLHGKKQPNQYLAYAQVGVDGVPRYGIIAAELHARFS